MDLINHHKHLIMGKTSKLTANDFLKQTDTYPAFKNLKNYELNVGGICYKTDFGLCSANGRHLGVALCKQAFADMCFAHYMTVTSIA